MLPFRTLRNMALRHMAVRQGSVGRRLLGSLVGAVLVANVAGAMEPQAVPEWLPMLKLQLKETNGCDLTEVLHWRDLKVGDGVGTEGRARCIDGREYDFTRGREHQKFTLRLCQPAVC